MVKHERSIGISGRPVTLTSGDGIRLLAGLAVVLALFQLLGHV